MAHSVETYPSPKSCPRCGRKEMLVSTYHFGVTWHAECKGCGLAGKSGDDLDTAKARLNNAFYEYEEKN